MNPISHQNLINISGQFKIIPFKGSVSAALNRLQGFDIDAPDSGILWIFLIDLFTKIDGLLEFPRLEFYLSLLVYMVLLFLSLLFLSLSSDSPVSKPLIHKRL